VFETWITPLASSLKETVMRIGEAWLVEWKDFDSTKHIIICQHPEKNSRSRAFIISVELCQMLQNRPKNSQYIFTRSRQPIGHEDFRTHLNHLKCQKAILGYQRTRLAHKLQNSRINQIHYHTLRHWKATQLYHKTKDIFYVMKFLGHRNIMNTLLYIDAERIVYPDGNSEDYTGKAATTREEKLQLIEAGFEFVCANADGTQYFRKRK
jgi:integrase